MAKRVTGRIKLQIMAGKATPAPPVGPALGQAGVNIMDFCKAFNAKTSEKELEGLIVPVVITVYHDRSFSFMCVWCCIPSSSGSLAGMRRLQCARVRFSFPALPFSAWMRGFRSCQRMKSNEPSRTKDCFILRS